MPAVVDRTYSSVAVLTTAQRSHPRPQRRNFRALQKGGAPIAFRIDAQSQR